MNTTEFKNAARRLDAFSNLGYRKSLEGLSRALHNRSWEEVCTQIPDDENKPAKPQKLPPVVSVSDMDDWWVALLSVNGRFVLHTPDTYELAKEMRECSLDEDGCFHMVSEQTAKAFLESIMNRDDCYDINVNGDQLWCNREEPTEDVMKLCLARQKASPEGVTKIEAQIKAFKEIAKTKALNAIKS
jgi:hypothetical protein